MAAAMDSPAHAAEELGVTKLAATCGHVFCRKELSAVLSRAARADRPRPSLPAASATGSRKAYVPPPKIAPCDGC